MKNKSTKQPPKFPPYVDKKDYEKNYNLQGTFRSYLYFARQNITEIVYLYQEGIDENIKESLINIVKCFDSIVNKLLDDNSVSLNNLLEIKQFYKSNAQKIKELENAIHDQLYPEVKKIYSNFHRDEENLKSLFQDFFSKDQEIEIDLNSVEAIIPPEYYDSKLNEDECNNYDKFVAVVNTIIYLRKIIKFDSIFQEKRKELKKKEKDTTERQLQEMFQEFVETNQNLKKLQKELKSANNKNTMLQERIDQLLEQNPDDVNVSTKNDENAYDEIEKLYKSEIQGLKKQIEKRDKTIQELKEEIEDLKTENDDLYKINQKLREIPATKEDFFNEKDSNEQLALSPRNSIDNINEENSEMKEETDNKSWYERCNLS